MTWAIAVSAALLVFAITARLTSPLVPSVAFVVGSTCLVPIAINPSSDTFHVGIAGPEPEIRTFSIVMLGILLAAIATVGVRSLSVSHLLFLGWVAAGIGAAWHSGPLLSAGILQLTTGVAAWSAGLGMAHFRHDQRARHLVCLILAGLVVIQVLVCTLQFAGVPINQLAGPEASILGDRVNGTANHPNNLGKLLIITLLLLLPYTATHNRQLARWSLTASLLMFIPLGLAQGRANLAAFVSALVIWTLLATESRFTSRRFAVLAGVLAGVGASATAIMSRFEEDPEGGVRKQLLQIAYEEIPENLMAGVGPNNYVAEVSSRFGSFIPVHNSFLLLLAEVGAIGALLFTLPIVRAMARSVLDCRRNPYSRAIVSVSPGILAIGWTGWGLLGTSVLPFAMFALAYTVQRARLYYADTEGPEADHESKSQRNHSVVTEGHSSVSRQRNTA